MLMPKQAENSKTNLAERSENMFCVKCGKELEDGYTFCPNCGTPQLHNATPTVEMISPTPKSITIKKVFLKKGILIAIAAVVVICIVLAIFSGDSSKSTAAAPLAASNTTTTATKTVDVVGKWQEKDMTSVYLTLNKDNTGEISSGSYAVKLNWTYSKNTNTVTLEIPGMGSSSVTYNPQKDTITRDGVVFVRVS